MTILAIETSCDETAIALIKTTGLNKKPDIKILSNIVSSQVKLHAKFGGVVPNLAKREHQRNLVPVLLEALAETSHKDLGFKIYDLRKCDILFMGGAQDKQQQLVAEDLMKKREVLQSRIKDGIPGLYICGAYQFLGKYYKEASGNIIKGLNILDLYTENPGGNYPRLIGNIVIESRIMNHESWKIVGFENHGGRTYLGKLSKPFGKVVKGFGNNGKDLTEGAVYKNSIGSYLHGPILPKNPELADSLIRLALEKKYPDSPISLLPLDNSLEIQARGIIQKRLNIAI